LHTGRSRNDQVALDLRLYLRRSAGELVGGLAGFAGVLANRAGEVAGVIVPAYTHLQQAQAVSLGHHLLAYAWMALRDAGRFLDVRGRLGVSPLGAGPAGGSGLPLDPAAVAAGLGLGGVFDNSLDAVASRDTVAEYAFCCSQAMVNVSRLAEELVLWATSEFGWVTYADALTTGSSALPHKKNPDIAELARGRSAGVIGDLTALLALQKGLPLAYNRDLQEDKRLVFHAGDTLAASLEAVGALVSSARFHPPPPSAWVGALDVAERLTVLGVPFRDAHARVGKLVAKLEEDGRTLGEATAAELAHLHPGLRPDDVPDPAASAARRTTPGGGAPALVAGQVEALRERIARMEVHLSTS
jgi:argininosuccinate lyase